jgi:hypothetical protein
VHVEQCRRTRAKGRRRGKKKLYFGALRPSTTLIATAKLNEIDPQAWLADVLARLPDHPAKRFGLLEPGQGDPNQGPSQRTDVATKAGPYRTARPNLTELQLLTWLLLLGGSHLCDQTLERLERLLGEISVEVGNRF